MSWDGEKTTPPVIALKEAQYTRAMNRLKQHKRGSPETSLPAPDSVNTSEQAVRTQFPHPVTNEIQQRLLRSYTEIESTAITWLWQDYLAAGKVHLISGSPGTGKTTVALSFAATVSRGGNWPDGTPASVGRVVIWSGEDDPRDTLKPRLLQMGAHMGHIYQVGHHEPGEDSQPFDPARDLERLKAELETVENLHLLIIDPMVSLVTGNGNTNPEVRRSLQPLTDLAQVTGCAVLGITHFSKGTQGRETLERVNGSLAYGALARVVFATATDKKQREDGRTVRLFCRVKSNIGPDEGGFEYELSQEALPQHPEIIASHVRWGKGLQGNARVLLAQAEALEDEETKGALEEAKDYLLDLLAKGPHPAKEVKAGAKKSGITDKTLRNAQKALGIQPRKIGGRHGETPQQWVWQLPADLQKMPLNSEDAHSKQRAPSETEGHLLEKKGDAFPMPTPKRRASQIRCEACRHFQRLPHHAHLGHCAQGEPEPMAGLWDTDSRYCSPFALSPSAPGNITPPP